LRAGLCRRRRAALRTDAFQDVCPDGRSAQSSRALGCRGSGWTPVIKTASYLEVPSMIPRR
ncbi:MAG: hypothetical protein KBS57_01345, partial [Alistipes sp.]|nr:hypothetical protein [Candidatus Minthomonas equi]